MAERGTKENQQLPKASNAQTAEAKHTKSIIEAVVPPSLLGFVAVSVGIIASFITMGIVQEKVSKKVYLTTSGESLKNNLVYLPVLLQSVFCLIFAKAWLGLSRRKEKSLLLHRNIMYPFVTQTVQPQQLHGPVLQQLRGVPDRLRAADPHQIAQESVDRRDHAARRIHLPGQTQPHRPQDGRERPHLLARPAALQLEGGRSLTADRRIRRSTGPLFDHRNRDVLSGSLLRLAQRLLPDRRAPETRAFAFHVHVRHQLPHLRLRRSLR